MPDEQPEMDRRTYLKTAAAVAGATSTAGCNTGGPNTSTDQEPTEGTGDPNNVKDDDPEQDTQDQKTETTGNTDPMGPSQLFGKFPSERTAEESGALSEPELVRRSNYIFRNREAREAVDDEIIEQVKEEAPENAKGWGFLKDGDITDEAYKLDIGNGGWVKYEVSGDTLQERFENNPRADNLEKISEDGDKITYKFDMEHHGRYNRTVDASFIAELDLETGEMTYAEEFEGSGVEDLEDWESTLEGTDEGEKESTLEAEGDEGKLANYVMNEAGGSHYLLFSTRNPDKAGSFTGIDFAGSETDERWVRMYLEDGEIEPIEDTKNRDIVPSRFGNL